MEVALGKYRVIDSTVKTAWNRTDKMILLGILALIAIGIALSNSVLFDSLISKDLQFIISIAFPLMFLFLLISAIEIRKPFAYTNEELFFFPHRLVIKSEERKEIFIEYNYPQN